MKLDIARRAEVTVLEEWVINDPTAAAQHIVAMRTALYAILPILEFRHMRGDDSNDDVQALEIVRQAIGRK